MERGSKSSVAFSLPEMKVPHVIFGPGSESSREQSFTYGILADGGCACVASLTFSCSLLIW